VEVEVVEAGVLHPDHHIVAIEVATVLEAIPKAIMGVIIVPTMAQL
jgi:hypothetical protein